MNSLLLTGARVIDPAADIDGVHDILILDGKVAAVERTGALRAPEEVPVIALDGCWVTPGLIDPHVHLRDPGFPEKETIATGLRAAAAGGFTAVAAMANTYPVNDRPDICRYMVERASALHAARLLPVSAVTRGLEGLELVDTAAMVAAGARLFSDDGAPIDEPAFLARALDTVNALGFAISLHEEDRAISAGGAVNAGFVARRLGVAEIPEAAESSRVRRDLALAIGSGAAIHVAHASTARTLELIRAARGNGAAVTCEVTPHHFTLDDSAVFRWGPNAKMSPPLRSREDVAALREGLRDGTVDMIATDHAPHDLDSKRMAFLAGCFASERNTPLDAQEARELGRAANGVVGLETALGLALELVHSGLITPTRLVELMSLNPARLLRLEGFGTLIPGVPADVTAIDPDRQWTVDPAKFLSRSRNTPFAGRRLKGRAILTLIGGEIVYDGRVSAQKGV